MPRRRPAPHPVSADHQSRADPEHPHGGAGVARHRRQPQREHQRDQWPARRSTTASARSAAASARSDAPAPRSGAGKDRAATRSAAPPPRAHPAVTPSSGCHTPPRIPPNGCSADPCTCRSSIQALHVEDARATGRRAPRRALGKSWANRSSGRWRRSRDDHESAIAPLAPTRAATRAASTVGSATTSRSGLPRPGRPAYTGKPLLSIVHARQGEEDDPRADEIAPSADHRSPAAAGCRQERAPTMNTPVSGAGLVRRCPARARSQAGSRSA